MVVSADQTLQYRSFGTKMLIALSVHIYSMSAQ